MAVGNIGTITNNPWTGSSYKFFIDDLELPYAPSALKIKINSNNKTVELVNGKEINLLKEPKLTDISFDINLPRGIQYPFANLLQKPEVFLDYFEKLKLEKRSARLLITRPTPMKGSDSFVQAIHSVSVLNSDFSYFDMLVSLEDYTIEENADNGRDVKVSLNFKEYRNYITSYDLKTIQKTPKRNTETTTKQVETVKTVTHTVKQGDTLMSISRTYYGVADKWQSIYNANKNIIEEVAQQHGRASSSNGHWIYPPTKLIINL